jgi:hypothetical protein
MTPDGYEIRAIYDDRGGVAGYVFQKPRRTAWGAIFGGLLLALHAGEVPRVLPRARGRRRGRRCRPQGSIAAMTHKQTS